LFSLERYLKRKLKKIAKRTLKVAIQPKIKTKNGYVKERKVFSNSKYEHREIAERSLGRKLNEGEVVHHIDHVRDNNKPSNLCVMSDKDHRHYHNWHRWMEKNKPGTDLTSEYLKGVLKKKWKCTILE
jgi:hypothetical protein